MSAFDLTYHISKLALVLLLVAALTACTTTAPVENPRQVWCEHNRPLPKLSPEAVASLSRADKEEMVARDLKGAAWCGWPK